MTSGSGVEVRTFRPEDTEGVRAVMSASLEVDAIPGFTNADIERALVRMIPAPDATLVALDDGRVVGVCTPSHDALTVHPDARRLGHGRRLALAARAIARARGDDALQLHVPPHLPASRAFARSLGMSYRSSMWQFELTMAAAATVPAAAFPDDVVVRHWDDAIDIDYVAWTAFMTATFEGHPTHMNWTPAIVEHVHGTPDFDASGILIVAERVDPTRFVAFTRLEMETTPTETLGEVGLIGVLPAWRGLGLGRELLRWGVAELRERAADRIILAVEAANERATGLYRAHGFRPVIEWPHWVLPLE